MRISAIGLLVLFFWFQIKFIFGNNGLHEFIKLNNEILKKKITFYFQSLSIGLLI